MTTEPNPTQLTSMSRQRRRWLMLVSAVLVVAAIGFSTYWAVVLRFEESTDDAYVNGNVVQITPQISASRRSNEPPEDAWPVRSRRQCGAVTKALLSGAMPQRGGVNERKPGWAKGSNPRRTRGCRNGGKHSRSFRQCRPSRGDKRRGPLAVVSVCRGSLQPSNAARRRQRVLERFRGGELTFA